MTAICDYHDKILFINFSFSIIHLYIGRIAYLWTFRRTLFHIMHSIVVYFLYSDRLLNLLLDCLILNYSFLYWIVNHLNFSLWRTLQLVIYLRTYIQSLSHICLHSLMRTLPYHCLLLNNLLSIEAYRWTLIACYIVVVGWCWGIHFDFISFYLFISFICLFILLISYYVVLNVVF